MWTDEFKKGFFVGAGVAVALLAVGAVSGVFRRVF